MSMSRAERAVHLRMMARSFNRAWTYLDRKHRSPAEDREMISLAHAARYHAEIGGSPRNRAIGDWQISRVYAALEEPRLSLSFAGSALEECERNGLSDLASTAHEALARAYAIGDDPGSARRHLERAEELVRTSPLVDEERSVFRAQIRSTRRLLRRRSSPAPKR